MTQPDDSPTTRSPRSDKSFMVAFIAVVAAVIAYFALGMPGMDHGSGSSMDGMDMTSETPTHRLVDPDAFDAALDSPDAVVINVHVPYDGELEGTDLFMPFDAIDPASLPTDQATPLLVYCRSGSMSAEAVVTLAALGYRNIIELHGGMNAWRASGRMVAMNPDDD
jgi:phage shock protein E